MKFFKNVESENVEKEACKVKLFKYSQLLKSIKNRENTESQNKQLIQKKWGLHNSYYPRPWDSYRSIFSREITDLKNENEVIKSELSNFSIEKKNLQAELEDCVLKKHISVL